MMGPFKACLRTTCDYGLRSPGPCYELGPVVCGIIIQCENTGLFCLRVRVDCVMAWTRLI